MSYTDFTITSNSLRFVLKENTYRVFRQHRIWGENYCPKNNAQNLDYFKVAYSNLKYTMLKCILKVQNQNVLVLTSMKYHIESY